MNHSHSATVQYDPIGEVEAALLSVLIRSEAFSFDVTHRRAFLI